MIATIFGVLLLVVAIYFVGVAFRGYPPGSYKSGMWLRQSTWGDIITALILSAGSLIGGLVLLLWVR